MPSAVDCDASPDPSYAHTPLRPPVSPITPVPRFAQLASQSPASSTEASRQLSTAEMSSAAPATAPSPPPLLTSYLISAPETHTSNSRTTTPHPHHTFDPSLEVPSMLPQEEDLYPLSYHIDQPSLSNGPPRFLSQPEHVDVPLEDNTDYIAVRAALNILQMQRDKSRRDLRTLSSLQTSLDLDPDRFYQQARAQGNLRYRHPSSDPLRATWEDMTIDESFSSDSDEDNDGGGNMRPTAGSEDKLPMIPSKQNVVRCPPVNWDKYHVVGESLDKMHEDQRRRPTTFDPDKDETRGAAIAEGFQPGYKVLGVLHEKERGK